MPILILFSFFFSQIESHSGFALLTCTLCSRAMQNIDWHWLYSFASLSMRLCVCARGPRKLAADTVFLLCFNMKPLSNSRSLSLSFSLPFSLSDVSCHRRCRLAGPLDRCLFGFPHAVDARPLPACSACLSVSVSITLTVYSYLFPARPPACCLVKFNSQGLCCWNVDFCWFGLVAATHITTHHNSFSLPLPLPLSLLTVCVYACLCVSLAVCVAPGVKGHGVRGETSTAGRQHSLRATKLLMKWIVMCVSISANDIPHTTHTHTHTHR